MNIEKAAALILLLCTAAFGRSYASNGPDVASAQGELQQISRQRVEMSIKVAELNHIYDKSLVLTDDQVHALGDTELRVLYGSLDMLASYTLFSAHDRNAVYVDRMEFILRELERRSIALNENYTALLDAFIATRDFGRATALIKQRRVLADRLLPAVNTDATFDSSAPSEIMVSTDAKSVTLRNVDLNSPFRIIVVSGCQFSRTAVEMIDADPALRGAFARASTVWLAPADRNFNIQEVAEWNRKFPRQQMTFAYKNSLWPGIDFSRIPTFYFFRDGKLVRTYTGWSKNAVPREILEILKELSLLENSEPSQA